MSKPKCPKCRRVLLLVLDDKAHEEKGMQCPKCKTSYLIAYGPKSPSYRRGRAT